MVIDFILVFIVTSVISFIGSLQPGPVNMAVLHVALTVNIRQAILVAIGGVIPELVYSIVALWFSFLFLTNGWLNNTIHIVAVVFFTVAGLYLIRSRQTYRPNQTSPKSGHFVFGLIAGFMNPMLFAFWLMILTVYSSLELFNMQDRSCRAAFILGSAAGAFLLLWLIAWYTDCKKEAIYKILPTHPSRITGVVFIILALWEFFKLILQS